jgi:hypothetical protein
MPVGGIQARAAADIAVPSPTVGGPMIETERIPSKKRDFKNL